MAGCICDVPRPLPYRPTACRTCGRAIDTSYVSSDETMGSFTTYLRSLPDVDDRFIEAVKSREAGVRSPSELGYLEGNPKSRALGLAVDLALQSHFYLLWCQWNKEEADLGAAMEAATFAAKAWEAMRRL